MNSPTDAEIFVKLTKIIDPHDGTWINPETPLCGNPPPASCGFNPNGLGGLAADINQAYPNEPKVVYKGTFSWTTVGDLAQSIADFYAKST